MALPAPAPPAVVPWELAGPGWGGACGRCTAAPSWLGGWAFPRVPSEPFAQRPCRSIVVTLGAEWGQGCHPKLSPSVAHRGTVGSRGSAACSLCPYSCQGSSLSGSVWMDRLQCFLCLRVLPEKVGSCLLSHQEVCLGSLFSWLPVGRVGCRRTASCVSCVLPPPHLQGLRACLGTGRGSYTQVSMPEDLQLPGSLRHPSPAPAAADCVFCPGQICVPVESSSPLVTSNRKEVLRCFTVLGTRAAPSVSSGAHRPDVCPPRWAWGVQASQQGARRS